MSEIAPTSGAFLLTILRSHQNQSGLRMAGQTVTIRTFHSRSTISKLLRESGTRLRASGQGHGNPSHLKFGYRKDFGRIVPHMGKQQIIGAIKDLRAERMTVLRIPSKNRKPRWHPKMVKRILDSDSELT